MPAAAAAGSRSAAGQQRQHSLDVAVEDREVQVKRRGEAAASGAAADPRQGQPSLEIPGPGVPKSRRLRPGQLDALKQSLLGLLQQELYPPESVGALLWDQGSVSHLRANGSLGSKRRR